MESGLVPCSYDHSISTGPLNLNDPIINPILYEKTNKQQTIITLTEALLDTEIKKLQF